MRVLIVNNYAHVTGGADLHCLEITKGLRERGHQVEWLATASPENIERSGTFIERKVGTENRDEIPLLKRAGIAWQAIWNAQAASAAKSLIAGFEPDLVHVHKAYVQLSTAPVVIAARSGIPLVQTVHDYEFLSASSIDSSGRRWDHDESRFTYRALNSATFLPRRFVHRPRINRWIAVSRVVANTYESVGGVECDVIPNFVAEPRGDPVARDQRNGVFYLGRLAKEKGIEHVLEAARALPEIQFTVAGDGPLKQEVEEAESRLPNLEFKGFIPSGQAEDIMKASVACLMPSLWQEPGPLSCLEAMANGTPVICYQNGGLAEYVSDSAAGIVCDGPTAEHLVSAVATLSSDDALWNRLSSGALTGTRERHSRGAYLDALEEVYGKATSDALAAAAGK